MGVGPLARWKQSELPDLAMRLRWAAGVAVVGALLTGWLAGKISLMASLGLLMGWWIVASVATDLIERLAPRGGAGLVARWRVLPRSVLGMQLAHLGVAVFIFGVTMVKTYEVERDVKMNVGDQSTIEGTTFTFRGVRAITGPNYTGAQGWIEATAAGSQPPRKLADLLPEKRVYRVQTNPMTEAAIRTRLQGDLYVSLGEQLDDGAWTVRIYIKPFVDWIWGGCLLMALGGFVAASDRRYRARARAGQEAEPSVSGARPQVAASAS
jgi:cytochrome c-type biogenesis protein CcmF